VAEKTVEQVMRFALHALINCRLTHDIHYVDAEKELRDFMEKMGWLVVMRMPPLDDHECAKGHLFNGESEAFYDENGTLIKKRLCHRCLIYWPLEGQPCCSGSYILGEKTLND
jgi:hypothetical protein